jgi:hypothetical protein
VHRPACDPLLLHPLLPRACQARPAPVPAAPRDIVPLGKVRSNWNFSLDDKRVLNVDNVVTDADNIKQVGWRRGR